MLIHLSVLESENFKFLLLSRRLHTFIFNYNFQSGSYIKLYLVFTSLATINGRKIVFTLSLA
jgi:hypothetical protein